MTFSMASDPVAEGEDQSAAPLSTPAPAVEQPQPATGPAEPAAAAPAAPPPPAHDPADRVTLFAVPPMGTMTVPPLEGGDGEPVVITRYGTEVDGATADRAHEAAALAGFTLRED